MEAIRSSETSVELHGVTARKIAVFIVKSVRTSTPTDINTHHKSGAYSHVKDSRPVFDLRFTWHSILL
jgi:hypothetical protein